MFIGGMVTTAVVAGIGQELSSWLVEAEAGLFPTVTLRAVLAILLTLPWTLWARITLSSNQCEAFPSLALWIGTIGLATLPPGLYANALIETRLEQARDDIDRERLVRAEHHLMVLQELGATHWPNGERLQAKRQQLSKSIAHYRRLVSQPLSRSADPYHKTERALCYIPLNRLEDAKELLAPLANGTNLESLLLAGVLQDQEMWAESNRLFESVWQEMSLEHGQPNRQEFRTVAFEGLLYNAKQARRPAEVERLLLLAIDQFPDRQAEWHFQLGQHHSNAGQPRRAVAAFERAADLDPRKYREASRREIDQIRSHTPACFLAGKSGS